MLAMKILPLLNGEKKPFVYPSERIFVCVCVKSVFNENICAASTQAPPSQHEMKFDPKI